jgi:hypothetical protein
MDAQGDPEASLRDALKIAISADEYWAAVGENLARGRIRGFVVADEIPEETRRIFEYLNSQRGDSRFLALEVPQFKTDGGVRTLVPQIVAGSLDPPLKPPGAPAGTPRDEKKLVEAIQEKGQPGAAEGASGF